MVKKKIKFDLVTFVAGAALKKGEAFFLRCNCEGTVTILPPFQEEFVVCPLCELKIKILVIDGDPRYVAGLGTDGKTPTLIPVQGSSAPPLTAHERAKALSNIEESIKSKK